jgi:hypothetical protein
LSRKVLEIRCPAYGIPGYKIFLMGPADPAAEGIKMLCGIPASPEEAQITKVIVFPAAAVGNQLGKGSFVDQPGGQMVVNLPNAAQGQSQNRTGEADAGIGIGNGDAAAHRRGYCVEGVVHQTIIPFSCMGEEFLKGLGLFSGDLYPKNTHGNLLAGGQKPLGSLPDEAAIEGNILTVPGEGIPVLEGILKSHGYVVIGIAAEGTDEFAYAGVCSGDHQI